MPAGLYTYMLENGLAITWEHSLWLLPLCLLTGALFAWLLYLHGKAKGTPWSKRTNIALAFIRFLLVSIICVLLLGPLLRLISRTQEAPEWVLAIDNSLSITETTDSSARQTIAAQVQDLSAKLQDKGGRVSILTLDGELADGNMLAYTAGHSDLSAMLKQVQNNYEGRNLAGVVLVSDGIYNQGMSPAFSPYNFPLYTVGVGDTIPRKDINLQNVYVNNVANQGNRFPLVAEVFNQGLVPPSVEVSVSLNGRVLGTERVAFEKDREVKQVRFLLDAEEEGMQHYVVNVKATTGEFTLKNNRKDAFVDVVKGKQKILIAAAAPHPDIKAIKAALESNQNYQVSVYVPGLQTANLRELYDVVIFHDLPTRRSAAYREVMQAQGNRSPGLWYVVGEGTNAAALNSQLLGMEMRIMPGQTDEVMPVYNPMFGRFTFSPVVPDRLPSFTPLTIPFGRFTVKGNTQVLLNQRVGSVSTSRPLLSMAETQGRKEAILLGTGLWRWRMAEFAAYEDHEAFNEIITKTVQYLSTREDKRKFRVFTTAADYLESEPVIFEAQLYNDVYERVYGQEVDLRITDADDSVRQYSFSTTESASRYRVSGLPVGVYDFVATTSLNGEAMRSSGQFRVTDLQIETLNLTADFDLLRKMSRETGAQFYTAGQWEALEAALEAEEAPAILHAEEQRRSVMDLPWLMLVLIILVSAEWALRRYHGSY